MIELNEVGVEKLWGDYDIMQLIYAVDAFDKVRCIFEDEENLKSPEARIQLLRIHKLLFKQLSTGSPLSDDETDELSLLISEADTTIFEIIEELEKIRKALRPFKAYSYNLSI